MKIAMMQPTFLPWQGMFELIYNCDKFIFSMIFNIAPVLIILEINYLWLKIMLDFIV